MEILLNCRQRENTNNGYKIRMDTRSRFLNSAAQIYATSVPALAAHLTFHHKKLAYLDSSSGPSLSTAARSCQACGAVGVPGWNSYIAMSTDPAIISARSKLSSQHCQKFTATASKTARESWPRGNLLSTECLLCRRFSKSSILPRKRVSKASVVEETLRNDQVMGSKVSKTKRSRNRSNTGLKALLERSKEPTTRIHGLHLMDLMKPA